MASLSVNCERDFKARCLEHRIIMAVNWRKGKPVNNRFIPLSSPVCSNAGVVDPTCALETLSQQKAILMDVCVMWHSTIELIKTTQLLDGDPTPSFCHTFLDSVTEWDLKKAAYTMEVAFHS
ncbi:hypothetical protein SAY87_017621 [Trapa incisa]|uniref:Uncharacterized protein n=1 Tax=Trapa incisa TaxID=236973 RepID=A0AAN7L4N4_9MYRT|nr:hypothetical protein SAY87_017621 [Trapa incisa]